MELKQYVKEVQRTMPKLAVALKESEYTDRKKKIRLVYVGDIVPSEILEEIQVPYIVPNNRLLDLAHMCLGMGSEIMEELTIALEKEQKDIVNIQEELVDCLWYVCNFANILKINVSFYTFRAGYNVSQEGVNQKPSTELLKGLGSLQDMVKRAAAYHQDIDFVKATKITFKVLGAINDTAFDLRVNLNQGMQNNINKLRSRFPDKFDVALAEEENRDRDNERKELEK